MRFKRGSFMGKSLEKWCIENERTDILNEFRGTIGDYKKIVEPSKVPYNSSSYAIWHCSICGSSKSLQIKERILINEVVCSKCKKQKVLDKRFMVLQSETNNIGYLAKTIQSSLPEQYIYYYLKRAFNNIESQKRFEWLGGMSIDIYIPEYKIGIEYDGERFHANRPNDKLKFELCKKNGVRLLRIVERIKAPPKITTDFADWYYLYTPNYDYTNISEPIFALLNHLDYSIEPIFQKIPLNPRMDIVNIEKHIKKEFDKKTLFYKWTELGEYWDFEKNGEILPNHIFKSDNKVYYLRCPKCDAQYGFRPAKRNKSIPPCPCDRTRYIKRENEIIHAYKSTGLIEFEDTLLDRQIEDEIFQTAQGMYQCFRYFGTIEVYELGTSKYNKPFLVEYFNRYTSKRMF